MQLPEVSGRAGVHEGRILIGLNYARRRARFNTAKVFRDAPTPAPLLHPFLLLLWTLGSTQEYTTVLKEVTWRGTKMVT